MNRRWIALILAIGIMAIGIAGCSDDATQPRLSDPPLVLRVAAGAPELVNPVVTFWAYYDRDSQAQIVYRAPASATDSVTLVDFTVPAQSLSTLPDGSTISSGDSVLITMSILNPLILDVSFEPSGLQFSSSKPARLRLGFGNADMDLNGDGSVDGDDAALEAQLHIWQQEDILSPWTELSSTVDADAKVVSADIPGFTHYAVAY
jgi:hypothetical protein